MLCANGVVVYSAHQISITGVRDVSCKASFKSICNVFELEFA